MFPVGRLDVDTEGLLLLTNDGDLAQPHHPPQPRRREGVPGRRRAAGCRPGALRTLRDGVELDDGITAPAEVSQPTPGVLRITIHEGRNRQVRRMCEAIGHPVLRLVRTRIGPISDRSLRPGDWRELSDRRAPGPCSEAVAESARRYDPAAVTHQPRSGMPTSSASA